MTTSIVARGLALYLMMWSYTSVSQPISELITQPALAGAQVGVYAVDMSTGKVLVSHGSDQLMTPASTQKVLTGITALRQLGSDYRLATTITYSGDITSDGTLTGDLIITGSHDPTLGSDRLDGSPPLDKLLQFIADKVSQQISCIDGKVVIVSPSNETYHPYRYWLYEDLGNYYGTPSYAINVQENTYRVKMSRTTRAGQDCKVNRVEPDDIGIKLTSSVTVGPKGSGDQAYILGSPGDYNVQVVGTLPPGKSLYTIKGSIPDPPTYFGRKVYQVLAGSGINSQGYDVVDSYSRSTTELTSIQSPTLSAIVTAIHQKSNNLYTEAMYSHMSWPDLQLGPGHKMVDACGLSPMNKISPRLLTEFLAQQEPSNDILSSLPVSGTSGTLKSLLTTTPYRGTIYAKSGSMAGVLCYAGYMKVDGEWKAFAVMINNFDSEIKNIKPIAEQLMKSIYDL